MSLTVTRKRYIHVFVALALGVLLKLCIPASNGLTEIGVNVIAVFIPIIYMWLTLGTDWSSFLCLALLFMTGLMTPAQVFSESYGNSLIVTIIGMMAFSEAFVQTGVIDTFVKWMLTREIVRNRPYVFMTMMYIALALLNMVMNSGALAILFIGIAASVCQEIGYKKGDAFYTAIMIGLFWVSNAFNAGSPMGHTLPLIMIRTAAAAGYDITYTQWLSIGVPSAILISALGVFCIAFIWRPEASKFINYDIDTHRKEVKPLTKQGIISVVLLVLVVIYWVVPTLFPNLLPSSVMSVYNTWGSTFPLIIAVCLLCIIYVDDKPVATFKEITKTCNIFTITFVGAVCALGTAVSSADTGISAMLNNVLSPLTNNMSTIAIVALSLLICLILTNFMSNTVCMLLFYSIATPLVAATGQQIIGLTIIICFAACFASLIPSCATTAPFFFGPDHITVKNTLKWNIIMILAAWVILVLMYLVSNMVFSGI